MNITDSYDSTRGPDYEPGSAVLLNCTVVGAVAPVVYQWTSTCMSDCYVLKQSSQGIVQTTVLHSTDSGNHTCTVTDNVGSTSSATIEVNVAGKCLF